MSPTPHAKGRPKPIAPTNPKLTVKKRYEETNFVSIVSPSDQIILPTPCINAPVFLLSLTPIPPFRIHNEILNKKITNLLGIQHMKY